MPIERASFNPKLTLRRGVLVLVGLGVVLGLAAVGYPAYTHARSMAHLRASLPMLCSEAARQRQVLVTAIENYKRFLNAYPPDHLVSQTPPLVDAATNQLLYELLGTFSDTTHASFFSPDFPSIRSEDALHYFHTPRFRNSGEDPQKIGHFLKKSDFGATLAIQERPNTVALLTYWPSWEGVQPDLYQQIDIGTWCYNSTAPIHNRSAYDLWIEIKTPLTNIVIANW